MTIKYNFTVVGKFVDPSLHVYQACLSQLTEMSPVGTDVRAVIEEYYETQAENRKRIICKRYGGQFLTHKAPTLIFCSVDEPGQAQKVLYFKNEERFTAWVAKYFNYKDSTHPAAYKRRARKAQNAERARTGRAYLNLAVKTAENKVHPVEVELFSEVLPESAEMFISRFEQGAQDVLKRIKKGHFLHFGSPNKNDSKIIQPESFQFTHSQPGLLGFCQTSSGEIDLNNWYITLAPMNHLDNKKFVIFGRIISGMRSCWTTAKIPTSWIGKPTETALIMGLGHVVAEKPEEKKTEKKTEAPSAAEGTGELSEDKAATRVQCAFRGKQGRKKVMEKKVQQEKEAKEEDVAATKVQSLYRGKKARKEVEDKKVQKKQEDELAAS